MQRNCRFQYSLTGLFEFIFDKFTNHFQIKLMNEEIDELNSSLRELRLENEEEIEFLRSKVVSTTTENSKS